MGESLLHIRNILEVILQLNMTLGRELVDLHTTPSMFSKFAVHP